MPAPDRNWTIAPTLLWFCVFLFGSLLVIDGDIQALADRVTTRREPATTAGPIAPQPVIVAEDTKDEEPKPTPVKDTGDRAQVGDLHDVCLDGTDKACKRWAMDGYYKAVAQSKAGKLGRPVRISWYGDSVIADDAIPARVRTRLQAELGDGGPGFVFAVEPHRFCFHETVTRTHDGDWFTHAISTLPNKDQMYGPGGSSTETHGGNATLKLATKATNIELYYVTQPNGGKAVVLGDGKEILTADTAGEKKVGAFASVTTEGVKKLELQSKGKIRLYGVDIENASGAVVDNFGIVSVHTKNFVARDVDDFVGELAHRSADLLIVNIGANEAQWLPGNEKAMKEYQGIFERAIAPIRKGRPEATCLVISPLDQAESKDGAFPSRQVMPFLVEAQHRAATANGCAFFSAYDWQGGKGSAAKWFKKGLVGTDFIHLSRKGANKIADGVFDILMQGYERYAKP